MLAREKEAEASGAPAGPSQQAEWESLSPDGDVPSTLGRHIPVLPNR